MSKVATETLNEAVDGMLNFATSEKKRKFLETVELQVVLKNYDPVRDKRFSGTIKLPSAPRQKFNVCILGNQKHCDEAKAAGIPFQSVDDLTKLKRNNKLVKKLAKQYHAFLASAELIKRLPRILGPGLNKAGKFPSVVGNNDSIIEKVNEQKASIKFQLKSKKNLVLGVPVGNVSMSKTELINNVNLSVNFLVSLLKKNWQNIRKLYIKSTMGPSFRIYGF
jgi:large subunit ribosomal protein L10Ae